MREIPFGEILSENVSFSSIADKGEYLTSYLGAESRRSKGTVGGWRGAELMGPQIKRFIFDISGDIVRAWSAEYQLSQDGHFDIGAYTRVASIADDLALNIVEEAFIMTTSQDEKEAQAGKNLLFHRYLNSAIAAIVRLRTQKSQFDFDPDPILESAVEITQRSIIERDTASSSLKLSVFIYKDVFNEGCRYLAEITGYPTHYFYGNTKNDSELRNLIENHVSTQGEYPTLGQYRSYLQRTLPMGTPDDKIDSLAEQFNGMGTDPINDRDRLRQGYFELTKTTYPAFHPGAGILNLDLIAAIDSSLNGNQIRVLMLRFGLGNEKIEKYLHEIGSEIGLSRERVRVIEAQAILILIDNDRRFTRKAEKPVNKTEVKIQVMSNTLVNIIHTKGKKEAAEYLAREIEAIEQAKKHDRTGIYHAYETNYQQVLKAIKDLKRQFKLA